MYVCVSEFDPGFLYYYPILYTPHKQKWIKTTRMNGRRKETMGNSTINNIMFVSIENKFFFL